MIKPLEKKYHAFFLSSLCHGALLLFGAYYVSSPLSLPFKDEPTTTYLTCVAQPLPPAQTNALSPMKEKNMTSSSRPKKIISSANPLQQKSNPPLNQSMILTLLHQAIANHQFYPEEGEIFQQKGSVILRFVLSPAGNLNEIRIIKSSDFPALDHAATMAVQAASPVREAGRLLTTSHVFTVKVKFG
ncbi:MAG: TonB family protein [Gammaproteobacteria bacterium]|nr:TonB family protein [Gammaproteobacteria bacterium]